MQSAGFAAALFRLLTVLRQKKEAFAPTINAIIGCICAHHLPLLLNQSSEGSEAMIVPRTWLVPGEVEVSAWHDYNSVALN